MCLILDISKCLQQDRTIHFPHGSVQCCNRRLGFKPRTVLNTHLCFHSRLDSSLFEVLQMDFEVEELSSPLDSQVIIWKLELPSASKNLAKTEGAMRIYTTQRDFVGLAPLVMVSFTSNVHFPPSLG